METLYEYLDNDVDYVKSARIEIEPGKRLPLVSEREWVLFNHEGDYELHKVGGELTVKHGGAEYRMKYGDFLSKKYKDNVAEKQQDVSNRVRQLDDVRADVPDTVHAEAGRDRSGEGLELVVGDGAAVGSAGVLDRGCPVHTRRPFAWRDWIRTVFKKMIWKRE